MKTGTIYKIENTINGSVYIGKTIHTLEIRLKQHIRDAFNNNKKRTVLGRAIRKYGKDSFTIQVIVEGVPELFLNSFERYWIYYHNSYKGKSGYNSTEGGDGTAGLVPWNKGKENCYSPETLAKMREAKIGSNTKPTNLKQLEQLAKERVGLKHQNAKPANIYEYGTNKLIAENVALTKWCRENGYSQGSLAATATGQRKQCRGLYAVYTNLKQVGQFK